LLVEGIKCEGGEGRIFWGLQQSLLLALWVHLDEAKEMGGVWGHKMTKKREWKWKSEEERGGGEDEEGRMMRHKAIKWM
jgi:hypothetical protein